MIYPQLTVFLLRMTGRFNTDSAAPAAEETVPLRNDAAGDATAGGTQTGGTDTTEGAPAGEADAAPTGGAADGGDRPLPPTDADGEEA